MKLWLKGIIKLMVIVLLSPLWLAGVLIIDTPLIIGGLHVEDMPILNLFQKLLNI